MYWILIIAALAQQNGSARYANAVMSDTQYTKRRKPNRPKEPATT
jgi:hypothetical protein